MVGWAYDIAWAQAVFFILNLSDDFLYLIWQLMSFESTILRNFLRVRQILKEEKPKKTGREYKRGVESFYPQVI